MRLENTIFKELNIDSDRVSYTGAIDDDLVSSIGGEVGSSLSDGKKIGVAIVDTYFTNYNAIDITDRTDASVLVGGNGNDVITGGFSTDNIYGGNQDDFLQGAKEGDRLFGNDGNDILIGGKASQVSLVGPDSAAAITDFKATLQAGNYIYEVIAGSDDGARDSLGGGEGSDILVVSGGVNASGTTYTFSQLFDLYALDIIDGSDLDFVVYAQALLDDYPGTLFSASLTGADLASLQYTEYGIEIGGTSTIFHSQDNQAYSGTLNGRFVSYGATGGTILYVSASFSSYQNVTLFGVKNVNAPDPSTNFGGTFLGGDEDDTNIVATNGADSVYAEGGNDTVEAGLFLRGYDYYDGGSGSDTISYEGSIEDLNITYNSFSDVFSVSSPSWDEYGSDDDRFANFERIISGQGDDTISGSDRDEQFGIVGGSDSVDGGGGVNTLDFSLVKTAMSIQSTGIGLGTAVSLGIGQVEFANIQNLIGGEAGDFLNGDSLSNNLAGWFGDDILIGGAGDDFLRGGDGSETYVHSSGDGNDVIIEGIGRLNDVDILQLTDLSAADVRLVRNGLDLNVNIQSSGETIIVENQFGGSDPDVFWGLEKIEFVDGTSWDRSFIMETQAGSATNVIEGTSGDDIIYGTDASDVIQGLAGSDYIDGMGGNDNFDGGEGDDQINGGLGNDIYVYANGDGNDLIGDGREEGVVDTLKFSDINLNDLTMSRSGEDLLIQIDATAETITLEAQYHNAGESYAVEKLTFADGSSLQMDHDRDTNWIKGTASAEVIEGNFGKDYIFAGEGADTISGGAGGDVYIYSKGDGNDVVNDGAGFEDNVDVLHFNDVNASEVVLSKDGDDLKVSIQSSGDIITIEDQFYDPSSPYWGVEKIEFADGSSWDLDELTARASPETSARSSSVTTASEEPDFADREPADASNVIVFPALASSSSQPDARVDFSVAESSSPEGAQHHDEAVDDQLAVFDQLHAANDDLGSDLWYEPEPIGALL